MSATPLDATIDPALAERLERLAAARGWTRQEVVSHALERGTRALEAEDASQLADDETEVLKQAIAALEQIPSTTFAAIGKPPSGD
jgi:hypothetical protein